MNLKTIPSAKKTFLGLVCVVVIGLHSSCSISDGNQKSYKTFELSIYSPYGCYHQIPVVSDGEGKFIVGYRTFDPATDSARYDSIIHESSFKLTNEESKEKIEQLISKIKAAGKKTVGLKNDAYRFQLIIDQQKIIDVFGHDDNIYDLLKILVNYLPREKKDKCEYFDLFKQSLSN